MNHLSEEQIVLHYYGDAEEATEVERHLAACPECRAEFARVQSMLQQDSTPWKYRSLRQALKKTWLNLRDRLPEKGGLLQRLLQGQQKWALAGAMIVLLAMAFLAGRFWPRPGEKIAQQPPSQVNPQRVVLVAVGDHLEFADAAGRDHEC